VPGSNSTLLPLQALTPAPEEEQPMPDYQLTLSNGTSIGFTDERELDEIIEHVIEEGYLRISGERTLVEQGSPIEGDFVAFESHIMSIST
jgi:hypothetical protein